MVGDVELSETKWLPEWFQFSQRNFWSNRDTQRTFLQNIAKQLSIHRPIDWAKVRVHQVVEMGGRSLLNRYGFSLFNTLQAVFPGWMCTSPTISVLDFPNTLQKRNGKEIGFLTFRNIQVTFGTAQTTKEAF